MTLHPRGALPTLVWHEKQTRAVRGAVKEAVMAGGNKSNSPKMKKRKIQEQAKARVEAEAKKRKPSTWQPRS